MSDNKFGKYVKYGAFKFQDWLTRYFKMVVIMLAVLFASLFFINLVDAYEKTISAGVIVSFNGKVINNTALKLSMFDYFKIFYMLFPQNNIHKINLWTDAPETCAGTVILDLFYIIALAGMIASIILSLKKSEKKITKLLPLFSLIFYLLGISIGVSLVSKDYTYDLPGLSSEPDWYFSWAFYILIVMLVFYATYYGLYLYFRNHPAPEKPVRTPKPVKEKPLSDKERIAQLEREVQKLKKQSNDNPPPADN